MIDVFKEIRERVAAEDVAKLYGVEFDRRGKAARCPFHHPDRHPSMTFKDGRYRCWACGASGNSIDLTVELLNLTPIEAVKKLNTDFSLSLNLGRTGSMLQERRQPQCQRKIMDPRKMFEIWKGQIQWPLADAYRVGHLALKYKHPDAWTEAEVLAIKWMPALEDWYFALDSSISAERMVVFRCRREVEQLCNRIIANRSLRKSTTA